MATVHIEDYLAAPEPWSAAFAAAGQGGTLYLNSGEFPCPIEAVPHGITIEGMGDSTRVLRRAGWYGPALNANLRNDVRIRGLRMVGNYGAFAGYAGFMNGEICINGNNNVVEHVTVDSFLRYGIEANGVAPTIRDNVINGVGDTVHSAYGVLVPESGPTSGVCITGNRVRGTYSAGIVGGGQGGIISGNALDNCHIGELPAGTGGGQLALARTMLNGVRSQSNGFVIMGNRVGPSTGKWTTGIELDSCYDIALGNNTVMGQYGFGVSVHLASSVSMVGGIVSACNTSGVRVGPGCFAISVASVVFRGNRVGVHLEAGGSNLLSLIGNQFLYQQESNLVNVSGAPNLTLLGNQWDSHDAVA